MSMPWLDKPSRPGFWWVSTPEGVRVVEVYLNPDDELAYLAPGSDVPQMTDSDYTRDLDWKWQRLYEPAAHPHAKEYAT